MNDEVSPELIAAVKSELLKLEVIASELKEAQEFVDRVVEPLIHSDTENPFW